MKNRLIRSVKPRGVEAAGVRAATLSKRRPSEQRPSGQSSVAQRSTRGPMSPPLRWACGRTDRVHGEAAQSDRGECEVVAEIGEGEVLAEAGHAQLLEEEQIGGATLTSRRGVCAWKARACPRARPRGRGQGVAATRTDGGPGKASSPQPAMASSPQPATGSSARWRHSRLGTRSARQGGACAGPTPLETMAQCACHYRLVRVPSRRRTILRARIPHAGAGSRRST